MGKIKGICIMLFIMLILCGCVRDMNYVIEHEPGFTGIVTTVTENFIVVDLNEEDPLNAAYDTLLVSLDVELRDSSRSFSVGDIVSVYYDGTVSKTSPGTVMKVYAICTIG